MATKSQFRRHRRQTAKLRCASLLLQEVCAWRWWWQDSTWTQAPADPNDPYDPCTSYAKPPEKLMHDVLKELDAEKSLPDPNVEKLQENAQMKKWQDMEPDHNVLEKLRDKVDRLTRAYEVLAVQKNELMKKLQKNKLMDKMHNIEPDHNVMTYKYMNNLLEKVDMLTRANEVLAAEKKELMEKLQGVDPDAKIKLLAAEALRGAVCMALDEIQASDRLSQDIADVCGAVCMTLDDHVELANDRLRQGFADSHLASPTSLDEIQAKATQFHTFHAQDAIKSSKQPKSKYPHLTFPTSLDEIQAKATQLYMSLAQNATKSKLRIVGQPKLLQAYEQPQQQHQQHESQQQVCQQLDINSMSHSSKIATVEVAASRWTDDQVELANARLRQGIVDVKALYPNVDIEFVDMNRDETVQPHVQRKLTSQQQQQSEQPQQQQHQQHESQQRVFQQFDSSMSHSSKISQQLELRQQESQQQLLQQVDAAATAAAAAQQKAFIKLRIQLALSRMGSWQASGLGLTISPDHPPLCLMTFVDNFLFLGPSAEANSILLADAERHLKQTWGIKYGSGSTETMPCVGSKAPQPADKGKWPVRTHFRSLGCILQNNGRCNLDIADAFGKAHACVLVNLGKGLLKAGRSAKRRFLVQSVRSTLMEMGSLDALKSHVSFARLFAALPHRADVADSPARRRGHGGFLF